MNPSIYILKTKLSVNLKDQNERLDGKWLLGKGVIFDGFDCIEQIYFQLNILKHLRTKPIHITYSLALCVDRLRKLAAGKVQTPGRQGITLSWNTKEDSSFCHFSYCASYSQLSKVYLWFLQHFYSSLASCCYAFKLPFPV